MIKEYLLTDLDGQVLNRIQYDFPLTADPYGYLATELDIPRKQLYRTVCNLREEGIIRRIGACFNSVKLGYVTTLAAAEVVASEIEQVAAAVNRFPEVTHNYQRDNQLNLWFTVIASSYERQQDIITQIGQTAGVRKIYAFPSCGIFKLKVEFRFEEPVSAPRRGEKNYAQKQKDKKQIIFPEDINKALIAKTCGDIDFSFDPYSNLAGELGICRRELLKQLRFYRKNGILRRFGAILRHQAAGFIGNGMTVWSVPEERINNIGSFFASQNNISHCYHRKPMPGWSYNLYAMIHGMDRESVRIMCDNFAEDVGINDYSILFSIREFKKISMLYFPEYS